MAANELRVTGLSFAFPGATNPILSGISFDVSGGARVGIWGRNGSGKTTLLRLLAGDYRPSQGSVRLNGSDVDAAKGSIATVSAEFDMFDYLSVERNIRFFLAFYGIALDADRLESLLSRYDLAAYRGKIAADASRGMRRKTQIVAALLMRPALLLADEPLDGLDEAAREQWQRDVATLAGEGGIVVSAVHDLAYLRARSDWVIMLDDPADGSASGGLPDATPLVPRGTPPRA